MSGHATRAVLLAGLGIAAAIALAAHPAAGETQLPNRPSDRAGSARMETLRALADQIGWGSLRQTEHMKLADTAYGEPPIIAVTAAPYLPVTFFLESRHWAAQRFLGAAEADARLAEIAVDPSQAILFDLLVITEDPAVLEGSAPLVRFSDGAGRTLPAVAVDPEVTEEPALGGALYAGRASVLVPLPDGFDWAEVDRFTLSFEAGEIVRVLEWTFPD